MNAMWTVLVVYFVGGAIVIVDNAACAYRNRQALADYAHQHGRRFHWAVDLLLLGALWPVIFFIT